MSDSLKKNTNVTWHTKDGIEGRGIVISDEEDGHVLVEVHSLRGKVDEVHFVIRCTVTWLTVVP